MLDIIIKNKLYGICIDREIERLQLSATRLLESRYRPIFVHTYTTSRERDMISSLAAGH